ncbi:hypothetical protein B0T25DRAFT_86888 [Lasiosphaeria hispida]|uniref:C3H1-type domain-containing protein n=1 Tax=Lasiosphaeria hispida TaxID=260671 RepID=A0AAJ0MHG4_9PEZI|nr:hypothetical protein B0T25DRAFT_86888 [Lasiosphaeria hispida]
MDQSHGNGMGEWDPNSFTGPWDHQFTDPNLTFDPNHGQDHTAYHNPDSYAGGAQHLGAQISGPDSQPSLYRPFEYFTSGDVWSGPGPTATSANAQYAHDSSISQGYYADHQPSNDAGQTVGSRFVLDVPHGNEFPAHLHASDGREASTHPFNGGAVNQPNPASGYIQGTVPQWSRVQAPAPVYVPNREYENPLASSQSMALQSAGSQGSPSPYPVAHGPVTGGLQNYHIEPHQQINVQQPQPHTQPHPQYHPMANGQQLQGRTSAAQPPAPARTASPRAVSQPTAQSPMTSQPMLQHPVVQAHPIQAPLAQASLAQHQVFQQTAVPVERNNGSALKRQPMFEESKVLAKKPKLNAAPVNAGSPLVPEEPAAKPVAIVENTSLLTEGRARQGGTWTGVPHLVIGASPVKLNAKAPTKRYVVISARGDRDPLFPYLPRGWTPAESLGNHASAYQAAKVELDRQRADTRLEIELRRGGNEIPIEWWKKLPKAKGGTEAEPKRTDPPPEPVNTAIKAFESLRIHPSHKMNRQVLLFSYEDYFPLLVEKAAGVRNAPAFDRIVAVVQAKTKDPSTFSASEFNALRLELQPVIEQLETAIIEGFKAADPSVLRKLGDSSILPVRLVNILIRLINIGDANTTLSKAILRLFSTFTNVKRSQLSGWKFHSTKTKLEAQGDTEVKDLINVIFANAEKNDDKDIPAPTKKKREMAPEAKKLVKLPGGKAVATAPGAPKRAREEDSNGDGRINKRPTTEASSSAPPGGARPSSIAGRPTTTAVKAPVVKGSIGLAQANTTQPPKPRSSLLLPGKIRPVSKPIAKPETAKTEGPKAPARSDFAPKIFTKPEATKPPASRAQPSQTVLQALDAAKASKPRAPEPPQPSKSKFAALLEEISEPKKVIAPRPPPIAATPIDETPEQKKRRLRIEERRRLNLRVTFKSEDRLVEVREFTRDPEEIGGEHGTRDNKSDRDRLEGMALKKSHAGELKPWDEPFAIDFAGDDDNITEAKRTECFVTRGGHKAFRTEQQKYMEDREARELMVVYTDVADIPFTPKSPSYEPALLVGNSAAGGISLPATPECEEIHQRARDRVQLGPWRAKHEAQNRLKAQASPGYADFTKAMQSINSIANTYTGHPTPMQGVESQPVSAEARDEMTYRLLASDGAKNWKDPDPYDAARPKTVRRHDYADPAVQKSADFIEDIVAKMRQLQPVPSQLSQPSALGPFAPQPAAVLPTTAPLQATQQASAAPDYRAAWAQYYAQQAQQQQQQAAWYAQQAQPVQQPQQPTQDATNQLSAILSALGNTAAAVPQPQYTAPDTANQLQALMAALQQPQQAAPAPAPAPADSQNAEYLLSLMQWASAQGGAAAPAANQTVGSGSAAYGQSSYGASHQERDGYGAPHQERDGFGASHQERDGFGGSDSRDRHNARGVGSGSGGDRNGPWGSKNSSQTQPQLQADVPEHLRGINRSLIGTKQCTFWARGQCAKGDKCTFRHD